MTRQRTGSRGTKIDGYWAYFPASGAVNARRFETEEDARGYIPLSPSKEFGKSPPLGPKVVIRVSWDYEKSEWSYDPVSTQEQQEVWEEQFSQFYTTGEAAQCRPRGSR